MDLPDIEPTVVTLKNGTRVTLRALRPDDRARIAEAVRGLDQQTIYTRLFSHRKELSEAGLDRIMRTDPAREVALVAVVPASGGEVVVGGARYVVTSAARAEVAFTVEEDYHGQGLGGALFAALATVARARGIAVFEADVLSGNAAMLKVFERTGLPLGKRHEGGSLHLELALAPASA
jgi:RimJ/RimL family protein N-acetyltransferase